MKEYDNDDLNEVVIDYENFFKTIRDKELSQNDLLRNYGIPMATMYRLRHNQNLTIQTLAQIMKLIHTDRIEDVVTIILNHSHRSSDR